LDFVFGKSFGKRKENKIIIDNMTKQKLKKIKSQEKIPTPETPKVKINPYGI
jgi:hypothetical protein